MIKQLAATGISIGKLAMLIFACAIAAGLSLSPRAARAEQIFTHVYNAPLTEPYKTQLANPDNLVAHVNLGFTVGQRLRLHRVDHPEIFAIYTVATADYTYWPQSWKDAYPNKAPIRMGLTGRSRLFHGEATPSDFEVMVDDEIVSTTEFLHAEVYSAPASQQSAIDNYESIYQGEFRVLFHPELREALGLEIGDLVYVCLDPTAGPSPCFLSPDGTNSSWPPFQFQSDSTFLYEIYDDYSYWPSDWKEHPIRMGQGACNRLMGNEFPWADSQWGETPIQVVAFPAGDRPHPSLPPAGLFGASHDTPVLVTFSGEYEAPLQWLLQFDAAQLRPNVEERLTLPRDTRIRLGLREPGPDGRINQQVRVWLDTNGNGAFDISTDTWAIYTVAQQYNVAWANWTEMKGRMGHYGRQRLGMEAETEFQAYVDTQVITSAACENSGVGLYECLDDPDSSQTELLLLAPHGGSNEVGTDELLGMIFNALPFSTQYSVRGQRDDGGSSHSRYHIASTELDDITAAQAAATGAHVSFPKLAELSSRTFDWAIALHGFVPTSCGGVDYNDMWPEQQSDAVVIQVGGLADPGLKQELVARLESAFLAQFPTPTCVEVVLSDDETGNQGMNPNNIVNRLTASGANGIQLEMSRAVRQHDIPGLRETYRETLATTLVDFYLDELF